MKFCYVKEKNILLFIIYIYVFNVYLMNNIFFDKFVLVVLIFLSVKVCIKFF